MQENTQEKKKSLGITIGREEIKKSYTLSKIYQEIKMKIAFRREAKYLCLFRLI